MNRPHTAAAAAAAAVAASRYCEAISQSVGR